MFHPIDSIDLHSVVSVRKAAYIKIAAFYNLSVMCVSYFYFYKWRHMFCLGLSKLFTLKIKKFSLLLSREQAGREGGLFKMQDLLLEISGKVSFTNKER